MAGGSSKPAKGTAEKKKRKRPSKKVPTTVMEASSNNFMNLVQKLTGSADEPSRGQSASPSPYPSPYSSPSNQTTPHAEEPPPHQQQQQSYYHEQYQRSSSAMDDHDSGSSHTNINYNYNSNDSYNSVGVAPYSYGSYSHQGDGSNYGSRAGYVGNSGSSRDNVDQDDLYQSRYNNSNDYTSNHVGYSRAMENDISPFSWRDPMNHNSTSDYWYHVDPAMRAS